ncbi:MAG TPA: outer membrane protein assembly factor BamD [Pelomicrobium sp.]|nr:outer membrane protein assembly factor BamD [Pelomicrobium sp.]
MRSSLSAIPATPLPTRAAAWLAALAVVLLAGCGNLFTSEDEAQTWSAQRLYSEAKDELNSGNYQRAIKLFETLEARYPYGRFAMQAQLEVAYAYYKDGEVAQAVQAADRFIKLHPNHPNVDYAYYLKGLAHFNTQSGFLANLAGQDLTERDPKAARDSFDAFKELVARFPESRYAEDARARMRYLVNGLAMHEVHAARYYLRRGAYVAAVNRATFALKTYPETPAVEDALAVMVVAYERLGLTDLSEDSRRVLEKNFPKSPWLAGGPESGSWWKFW